MVFVVAAVMKGPLAKGTDHERETRIHAEVHDQIGRGEIGPHGHR